MNQEKQIQKIASFIKKKIKTEPVLAVVLGSGLSGIENLVSDKIIIPYNTVPFYPKSSVQGHKNRFIFGYVQNKPVLLCSGRFHLYEGFPLSAVILPIRILKALGTQNLLLTNAAGGINPEFNPADIMLITDHINLTGRNPLIGYKGRLPVFIDMTEAYNKKLQEKMQKAAEELHITLKSGIYAFQTGPSYETPAEIRALQILGASAVGMSTVPEITAARQENIPAAALSIITNKAAGLSDNQLGHEEVLENSLKAEKNMIQLIQKFIEKL